MPLSGNVEESDSKKIKKWGDLPRIWTDSLNDKSVFFEDTEESSKYFL